jgi:adenylate cyclase
VDPSGDGGGGVTATGLFCRSCGVQSSPSSKFCGECGTRLTEATRSGEYKQVTVLFADVVRSMAIAAAVGLERLREIMTELAERSAAMVRRYGGTVDYTGDGVMAIFGAPMALEDHAFRACLAALAIQEEANELAVEIQRRDGVALRLRVGLNSGRVIAGEIGSGSLGYTAIGEPVGFAQRMESVAPPGGVMLAESTTRLVEHLVMLSEPEWVRVKGADEPVRARRLVAIQPRHAPVGRAEASLVGRRWEMAAVDAMVDRAIGGRGGVVGVVGAPGIGKSRSARETAALAADRGVEVVWAFCESHARDIPFYVVTRLLRGALGIEELAVEAARAKVRAQLPGADEQDLTLLDDLLNIADPAASLAAIDPDARRRRLTALITAASLVRTESVLYIVEDAQWIDEVSESMLADFFTVIPETLSMVLVTYRPEYQGALARLTGAQTIALAPLCDSDTAALLGGLLGSDASVGDLAVTIAERAAGNPFFVEEMVRELLERGALTGDRGGYVCRSDVADLTVPATVQAAMEARIDRLNAPAKRTLNAASVIGSRFGAELLTVLGIDPVFDELLSVELIDQVRFTPRAEYVFHHPLIRAVAYESQLKSDRAEVHRRLAAAIESGSAPADQNAALIAEHLEAAGELHAAYGWHMRSASWLTNRDIGAARASWLRAREVADRLADDDPDRTSMRIAPRTLLCGYAWRVGGGSVADTGFDELRELCGAAADQMSLVMGMSGMLVSLTLSHRLQQLLGLASEYVRLLESMGDSTLIVGLLNTATHAKFEAGEITETLPLVQRVIELADGNTTTGNFFFESPLAWAITLQGLARCSMGHPGWRDDLQAGFAMARQAQGMTQAVVTTYGYGVAVLNGALMPDAKAMSDTADALRTAERSGDDVSLAWARVAHGIMLVRLPDGDQTAAMDLLAKARQQASRHTDLLTVTMADIQIAEYKAHTGDIGGAIETSRATAGHLFDSGEVIFRSPATTVLVESLLRRGTEPDLQEAQSAVDRLAACPIDPGCVLHELPLLRLHALLARARGAQRVYCDYRDRYRDMATTLGFEGHMKWAEAMP